VITASCIMGNVNLSGDEEAICLFFIIFPAVLFFVILFMPARVVEELTGLTPPQDLSASKVNRPISPKSRLAALLFCLVPWPFALVGLQRLYAGKIKTGILWILTLGLLGIGQLIDVILILTGGFRDGQGRLILDWNPKAHVQTPRPGPNPVQSVPEAPMPAAGPAPEANPKAEASAPIPAANPVEYGSSTSVWQAVDKFNPVGRLLAGLGFVLLFVATIAGLFFALHVPWFISGGFPDPGLGQEIEAFFGFPEWPNLVETLGFLVCFLTCLSGLALVIIGRRRAGAFHIIRAVIGVAALVTALMIFSEMIPSHYFEAPTTRPLTGYRQEQRDEFRQMLTDQQTGRALGYLVDHVDDALAILGTGLMIVSVVTMAWPAKRQRKQLYPAPSLTV
jgi:TM2 domain-containing membrane protein YozV